MLSFSRTPFFLIPGAFLAAALAGSHVQASDPAPPPVVSPLAAPAFLDVVSFAVRMEGQNHKIVVTNGANLVRVDEPDDGYSIIYNAQTDYYIGLEHRNYTYWEFSWPQVRAAVELSQRYETHLQQLGSEGLGVNDLSTSTNAPAGSSTSSDSDSGYVWRPTSDRKRIADLDCVRWTGDTVSGENVEAWCYNGPLPKLQAAMEKLRTINEPIALVPVRTIVPDFAFMVYDGLVKGGVTPVLITWGSDSDKNRFAFLDARTREGKLSLFTVPKLYIKTTLVTMDGMLDQKK
jgi:hypothetical protein